MNIKLAIAVLVLVASCQAQVMQQSAATIGSSGVTNNIAIVQKCPSAGVVGGNNSVTSIACTFSSNNTSGTKFIVWGLFNAATLSVSDGTNSYTAAGLAFTQAPSGTPTVFWNVWCAPNTINGSTATITVSTTGAAGAAYMGAAEVSGMSSCTPDTTASTNAQGSLTSPAYTTTNAADGIFVFAFGGSGGVAPTAGTVGGNAATALLGSTSNGGANPAWEWYKATATQSSATANFATGSTPNMSVAVVAYPSQ